MADGEVKSVKRCLFGNVTFTVTLSRAEQQKDLSVSYRNVYISSRPRSKRPARVMADLARHAACAYSEALSKCLSEIGVANVE